MLARFMLAVTIVFTSSMAFGADDDADAKIRDRYLSLAIKNPRRGPAVEKLYQIAAQSEGIDALIQQVEKTADAIPAARLTLIGLLEEMRGHEVEALAAYQKAGQSDEKAHYPRYCAGLIHLHRNDYNAAIENLTAALKAEPPREDA